MLRRINIAFFSQRFADSRPASSVHLAARLKDEISRLEAELSVMSDKVRTLQAQLDDRDISVESLEGQLSLTLQDLQ